MNDDGHIHNRVVSDKVHRIFNGIFGAVVFFAAGAAGLEYFGDNPILRVIALCLVWLAIPFGIVMLFVNPKKISLVEGHTSPDVAYDELTETKEDQEKQNH